MATTIVTPSRDAMGNHPPAIADALIAGLTAAAADVNALQGGGVPGQLGVHGARGVVTANVASLAAFTVAGNDGLTYVAGDRVLLTGQTTGSECGLYSVGTVSTGTAPLTRVADFDATIEAQSGSLVFASEGTSHANSLWSLSTDAPITLGTSALVFNKTLQNPIGGSTGNTWGVTGSGVGGFAALNLAGGSAFVSGVLPLLNHPQGMVRHARGVVGANVASLASFTVAAGDGVTFVAGDRVLLARQNTAAENGLYVVGTVSTGTAPLTRATDMPAAATYQNAQIIEVSEGTLWVGSTWKAMATGTNVIGTDDAKFYPMKIKRTVTLVAGAYTFGVADQLFLFSAAGSTVSLLRNTANTSTATTGGYSAPVASRTAGISGTASLLVRAEVAAGTLNNADISTVDVVIHNA